MRRAMRPLAVFAVFAVIGTIGYCVGFGFIVLADRLGFPWWIGSLAAVPCVLILGWFGGVSLVRGMRKPPSSLESRVMANEDGAWPKGSSGIEGETLDGRSFDWDFTIEGGTPVVTLFIDGERVLIEHLEFERMLTESARWLRPVRESTKVR